MPIDDNAQYWQKLATELDSLAHGARGKRLKEVAETLNLSPQTVYRRLNKAGWTSNNSQRSDKGEATYNPAELQLLSNYILRAWRDNNKRLLSVADAIEILVANHKLPKRVHPNTAHRLLRQANLHPEQLQAPRPHTRMRSLHPNHVWQFDPSVCVLFYTQNGQLAVMEQSEFYKNKPDNLAKIETGRALRYVVTDHYSGAFKTRYYVGSGETQELLIQFLIWAFSKQDPRLMYGVPKILIWDKGSANTAHMAKAFLDHLSVQHIAHEAKNPRAKGQVEKNNDLIECHFEGRLANLAPKNVDELNAYVERWQVHYNLDKKMLRHKHTRTQMWQKNTVPLRLCPPSKVCIMLCEGKPETRKVRGDLTVQYAIRDSKSQMYSVKHIPDIRVNQEVKVFVNPFNAPNVNVTVTDYKGEAKTYECTPIATNEAGFPVDAPVFGEEHKRAADTPDDKVRDEMLKRAYNTDNLEEATKKSKKHAQAFADIDGMADVAAADKNAPSVMQRAGREIEVQPRIALSPPLTFMQTVKRVRQELGDLTPAQNQQILAWHPDGIAENDIPQLVERLRGDTPTILQFPQAVSE